MASFAASTSHATDLTLGKMFHPLSPSADVPAKERKVKKRRKARMSWRRERSKEEAGKQREDGKQAEDRVPGRKGGSAGRETLAACLGGV